MTSSPPLHVAIDIGPLYGHRTGVGVAADGMVTALEQRADVELSPYLVSFRSSPAAGHRRLPLPGIVASHAWSRLDRPGADRWLRGADVVHGTNYVAPPTSLPTVISVYDCWFARHRELATPVVRRAERRLRRALSRGAWLHTSSDATAAQARDVFDTDRVTTVRLGLPPVPPALDALPQPAIAGDLAGRPFVAAIATEERRKDLPSLVDAFGELALQRDDIALVMAGAPGDQTDEITAAIDRLPSAGRSRLHRIGIVDDPTKHWLLRRAAVLAYPSLDEGFGFPLLEAHAVGTPVVASRVGSIPEIAGDAAIYVDDRDAAAFAAGLAHAIDSSATRLGLIEAGYRNLRRFSWEATADGLVQLYRRTIESSA